MSDSPKPLDIVHDEKNQVFRATVDGYDCEVEYRLQGHTMVITHTGVPSPVGGRGIAALLTKRAVETAEAKHWKVEPACSYAETWFRRNPDFDRLRA